MPAAYPRVGVTCFSMDWPGQLETVPEVDIETRRADDAPVHRTTIWAAVEGGDVYVRSLRGAAGRWYRELMAHPEAILRFDGESIPVRGVKADDPESVERCTAGYRAKYGGSSALGSMLRDEIADTTVRLEPR
jgi:hypothetical protein